MLSKLLNFFSWKSLPNKNESDKTITATIS